MNAVLIDRVAETRATVCNEGRFYTTSDNVYKFHGDSVYQTNKQESKLNCGCCALYCVEHSGPMLNAAGQPASEP